MLSNVAKYDVQAVRALVNGQNLLGMLVFNPNSEEAIQSLAFATKP